MDVRALFLGETQPGEHRRAALRTGHQPDVRDPGACGLDQHGLLVAAVRGDDDDVQIGRQRLPGRGRPGVEAERTTDVEQSAGDGGVSVDVRQRRGEVGLQEDVERPARQAGIGHRDQAFARLLRAFGPGVRGGRDPQQQRLAGLQHPQALQLHRRLGACAAHEALDGAVGQHQRAVPGLGARGPFRVDDGGQDERGPAVPEHVRAGQQFGVRHRGGLR